MRWSWVTLGAGAVMGAALGAGATDPGRRDAALVRGEHIARLVCSACHSVADDQEFPPLLRPPAPAFKDIANRPGMSPESVRHFVTTTHWDRNSLPMRMPDPMLLPEEANDVARYLMSLRRR